jgi:hypothetical protein
MVKINVFLITKKLRIGILVLKNLKEMSSVEILGGVLEFVGTEETK